jgi:hypothetical protein
MRVFVVGATGAIGDLVVPGLAGGGAGAVLMTEIRGAFNVEAERELPWGASPSGWRQGFTAV